MPDTRKKATTPFGDIQFSVTAGLAAASTATDNSPHYVLFVHGSPGGVDQGELLSAFLVQAGFTVIAVSRPGYLGTPLTEANGAPEVQADMYASLLDHLQVSGPIPVVCWSGGGPSSFTFAAKHPERVACLVAIAAVSKAYTWKKTMDTKILDSWVGEQMIKFLKATAPDSLVKSTLEAEGKLEKQDMKELESHVLHDPKKRQFVLDLAVTATHRSEGLHNDQHRYPQLSLAHAFITAPTLLVYGTADSELPLEYGEFAKEHIQGAELLRVEKGTHVAVWTDPKSEELQAKIVAFLKGRAGK